MFVNREVRIGLSITPLLQIMRPEAHFVKRFDRV
jgi:hypothetical protein